MTDFRTGDKVRIVHEGEVERVITLDDTSKSYIVVNGWRYYLDDPEPNIELIERPVMWTDGDIVITTNHRNVWWRENDEWVCASSLGSYPDDKINTWVQTEAVEILRKQKS